MALNLAEFARLIEAHGPNLQQWPAATLEPALDLLARSDAAKDLFTLATQFELSLVSEENVD